MASKMLLLGLCCVGLVLPSVFTAPTDTDDKDKGEIWAVLVAGSNTYNNYRHQADVCHAYQIFRKNGVPDSNIIVMMYDDIANNDENPKKGKIFNKPGGPDVYKHVPKDYTGENVTPENFIHVLTGNSKEFNGVGSGKVLKSGPNDHVFINFVDHGGAGLIGFPNGVLNAADLITALKKMHKKKMYKKLLFYMEACESGSMFANILPKNINIFATTAANPSESSFACYWDDTLQIYLGDEYSVSWMEDTDTQEKKKKFSVETLLKQYKDVVKNVKDSHPQMYGHMPIEKEHAKDFLGSENSVAQSHDDTNAQGDKFKDSVSSRDVALQTLNRKIDLAKSDEDKLVFVTKRETLIKGRKTVDGLFYRILSRVASDDDDVKLLETSRAPLSMEMMDCYKILVDNFSSTCININKNTYALAHMYKLANLCSLEYTSTDKVLQAYNAECDDQLRALTDIN